MTSESLLDTNTFKALLTERQNALERVRHMAADAAEIVELDQTKVGRLSRMDALQAQEMSLETNRRRDIELQRIASALQRIEDKEFGYCLKCGEDISMKRLEIDPSTPVCIDCASTT